jgi:hypothetical protein
MQCHDDPINVYAARVPGLRGEMEPERERHLFVDNIGSGPGLQL